MRVDGVQRLVSLPPAPESARHARRLVLAVIQAAGAEAFADTATLLTSELVTNGIVHAHTPLHVVVEATRHWVRVEVSDGNRMLPSRRGYDEDASTGRGLEMVELLADEFGIQPLDDGGKRVWFRLGGAPSEPTADEPGPPPKQTVPVLLCNLPVMLYLAWQAHADGMLREATLDSLAAGSVAVPEELALASQALAALATATAPLLHKRDGLAGHVDVEVVIPRIVVADFPVLRDVLRQCATRADAGELLVPTSLPEIQAVRRWVCDEVGRQAQGLPARAWTDIDVDDIPFEATASEIVQDVHASALALVAADRWNRVIAVSETAAELLGWMQSDLEGRRLTVIIPPALRDAHIAGFTHQMLGGTSSILGQPTEVSALRRDGSEVAVVLEIRRRADQDGRPVFVATLTPRG